MSYTVNKLAKLSGVSVRTLHFYDEIGLLKPAYYGENNYRYYEEDQLLMLQQILFYRELGVQLNAIQKILASNDFDKIQALNSHKKVLLTDMKRTNELIKTIDKTISHLQGETTIPNEEFYKGFNREKHKEYEDYLMNNQAITKEVIDASYEKVKQWEKSEWDSMNKEGDEINRGLAAAIDKNLAPESPEVQHLIYRHFQWVNLFWTPTRESYIGLSQLYCEHPDFKNFYTNYHPQLLEFLVKAMKYFAENQL